MNEEVDQASGPSWRVAWLPMLGVALVVAALCWGFVGPESRQDSHWWRGALAAAGGLLAVGRAALSLLGPELRRRAALGLSLVVLALGVFGSFNYFQFNREVLQGIGDRTDVTYYYINSKYLPELGYFRLYPAMLLADQQGANHHTHAVKTYRDLSDYEVKGVDHGLRVGAEIEKERFTPERWAQFKHDVDYFISAKTTQDMVSNFYVDHGYNPPPMWSIVGGALSGLVEVEHVKWITSVDILLVVGMFAAVGWAFGPEGLAWALLFFVTTFSGRWPILGEALLRFDWLSALVASMCFLRKGWWGTAGTLLAYAACNRIFPAIYFLGPGLVIVREVYAHRKLLPTHLRFVAGAGAMTAVLVLGAAIRFGPNTFVESKTNLLMHNLSYSSHRVGLGDLSVYRGEYTRPEINETVLKVDGQRLRGIAAKEVMVQQRQPWLRLAGLICILLTAAYAMRVGAPAWVLLPLATLPLYCVTNAQINYWNLRLVLILLHVGLLARPRHALALGWLLAVEVVAQRAQIMGYERYTVTSLTSVMLAPYFLAMLGVLGWGALRRKP